MHTCIDLFTILFYRLEYIYTYIYFSMYVCIHTCIYPHAWICIYRHERMHTCIMYTQGGFLAFDCMREYDTSGMYVVCVRNQSSPLQAIFSYTYT